MMDRRWIAVALLGLGVSGCSTVGASRLSYDRPVGYDYRGGTGSKTFTASPDLVNRIQSTMEEVGVHAIRQVHQPDSVSLEGLTADRRRAFVTVSTGPSALVTARFGALGDNALTLAFFERMGQATKSDAPADPETKRASTEPKRPRRPIFSRDGVSDEEMLKGQADVGYRDTLVP